MPRKATEEYRFAEAFIQLMKAALAQPHPTPQLSSAAFEAFQTAKGFRLIGRKRGAVRYAAAAPVVVESTPAAVVKPTPTQHSRSNGNGDNSVPPTASSCPWHNKMTKAERLISNLISIYEEDIENEDTSRIGVGMVDDYAMQPMTGFAKQARVRGREGGKRSSSRRSSG